MSKEGEKLRIDKYLWSIRLFKTRGLASEACDKGRVKLNGEPVKPARSVKLGDVYELRTEARKWIIRVTGLLHNRVAYQEAILHYEDITPPDMLAAQDFQAPSFHTGKRLSKTGRPTKQQRRNRDDVMGEG